MVEEDGSGMLDSCDAAAAQPSCSELWGAGPYSQQDQALLDFCVLST